MKRWSKWTLLAVVVSLLLVAGYVLVETSYRGNSEIVLLNEGEPFPSFRKILQQQRFKNKVVYVDVWGTSCLPCFDELKNYTPGLTARYKNNPDIAFLYICLDRHPLPEVRWKSKIRMFKPPGYHVLVTEKEEGRLSMDIMGTTAEGGYFPYIPYYVIIDKQGHIVGKPSPDPEKGELRPSSRTALYDKLDSLMKL